MFSLASVGSIGFVTLFTSIVSARLYGITAVGQAALAMAPVTIIALMSTVREQPAMVRELAKLEPRHPRVTGISLAVFALSFTLTALASALGLVVCWFLYRGPLKEPGLFAPACVSLCGYLLIINTCWNADSVFGAFRAGRELFAVRLHQALSYGAFVIAFTLVAHNVWGLVLAFLASWLSALVHRLFLLTRVMRWRVPLAELRAGFSSLREIVIFGLKLTPGSLASGVSEASGTWILGATTNVNAVGAYSRAWNLTSRMSELNWRITEMLLPTLVQRRAAGDSEGFERVLLDSMRYAAFGLLLPAAVAGGAAESVMHVFGEGFGAAAPALRWLLFLPLLLTLTAIQGTALMATDRPLVTAFVQMIRLVVTLACGVALSFALGISGMAITAAGGALLSFIAYGMLLRRHVGTPKPALTHARLLAGMCAGYAAGFASAHLLEREIAGVAGLVCALTVGSAAYLVVGLSACGTTECDRARLRALLDRIGRGRELSAEIPGAA